jgi:hypothetical protein
VSLPRTGAVVVFAAVAAALAAAAPLAAYAGSLALFGLPHVLAELRYVDGRFGRRTSRGHVVSIAVLLALVVALRALVMSGRVDAMDAIVVELGLVAVLAFVVVPTLLARPLAAVPALLVGGALLAGSWAAPLLTVVLLAVLHNVTPVGFLFERLGVRGMRGRAGWLVAILFVGVPLLIASGLPSDALAAVGVFAPEATFGSVGGLAGHRRVFVPGGWFAGASVTHAFAAATYLQLLHYGAVLLVLPRLLRAGDGVVDRPLLPWPRARVLACVIAALALVTATFFVRDFRGTRAAYGMLAAVHAWIEIPVLLLALAAAGSGTRDESSRAASSAATARVA